MIAPKHKKQLFAGIVVLSIIALGTLAYRAFIHRTIIDSIAPIDFETDPAVTGQAGGDPAKPPHDPKICPSIMPAKTGACPPKRGLLAVDDSSNSNWAGSPAEVEMNGSCCELPASDILTTEHVYNVEAECPSNHVITGTVGSGCGERDIGPAAGSWKPVR